MQKVVYIFDREGANGGPYWLLVLECGHTVSRARVVANMDNILRPMAHKLAPKRVRCHYCGIGCEPHDPWPIIKAIGGDEV